MNNLNAELAYFRQKIDADFAEHLAYGKPLPSGTINAVVLESPFANVLAKKKLEELVKELEASYSVLQRNGATVSTQFREWLPRRQKDINFFYWERLKRYYLDRGMLPPQVVATLDRVSNEVLGYCGDPAESDPWNRRGMVIGHVQSGKTTNYSALICKAADAGYKIVILLAGLTNTLRSQTQERLDEYFIGRKSVFGQVVTEPMPIVQYASEKRFPARGTSRDKDFRTEAASTYGVSLSALNEPIIFVVKKNLTTLRLLRDWLSHENHGESISEPLLLIDDEADNASVNTQKDPGRVTAINGVMREVLSLFDRSSYVGYTATPFANIFIDPETEHSMLGDDLFPRDFIKALDPPSNYVGATRVFDEDGDLHDPMVRIVGDYRDILPLKHKRHEAPDVLPPSLLRAIRVFVLTRALRILRGDGSKHCTMMINVSRFNDIQEAVQGLAYKYLEDLKSAVSVSAGLGDDALKDPVIQDLCEDFENEFSGTEFTFDEVLGVLHGGLKSIVTATVNMRGGGLDYSNYKDEGLHVIAIGGLALSRGLTLEGLTVSYILRNTAASDTLMQMARWFGYRPGYEDLCRVYLPEVSYEHYLYINEAIEELRSEVKRMQEIKATPSDFGLRVRQSPTAIRITAANKMRSAKTMTIAQDYSGRHVEGHVLFNDRDINRSNVELLRNFLSGLGEPERKPAGKSGKTMPSAGWQGIPGQEILRLMSSFQFPAQHGDLSRISGDSSLLADYVRDRLDEKLGEWDVAIPGRSARKANSCKDPFSLGISIREREKGHARGNTYRVYGGRNRVADPADAKLFLTQEQISAAEQAGNHKGDTKYCMERDRPLLLIHVFSTNGELAELRDGEPPHDKLDLTDPVVSLSFCLPGTSKEPVTRTYQVNQVYRKQLDLLSAEPDDDEDAIAEGDYV
ncbi:Z1 domain-containing protein [Ruegeria sp. HKCCA4008]|uniref:Z1 domain-containing protein n=1 Tax=Ruegeria sp. HKCCA4008 TaxID=2682999 RepID=UPI00148887EF|nr:Z1 domain-containing protein [Ruegeria sp. HKCCA4008]